MTTTSSAVVTNEPSFFAALFGFIVSAAVGLFILAAAVIITALRLRVDVMNYYDLPVRIWTVGGIIAVPITWVVVSLMAVGAGKSRSFFIQGTANGMHKTLRLTVLAVIPLFLIFLLVTINKLT